MKNRTLVSFICANCRHKMEIEENKFVTLVCQDCKKQGLPGDILIPQHTIFAYPVELRDIQFDKKRIIKKNQNLSTEHEFGPVITDKVMKSNVWLVTRKSSGFWRTIKLILKKVISLLNKIASILFSKYSLITIIILIVAYMSFLLITRGHTTGITGFLGQNRDLIIVGIIGSSIGGFVAGLILLLIRKKM